MAFAGGLGTVLSDVHLQEINGRDPPYQRESGGFDSCHQAVSAGTVPKGSVMGTHLSFRTEVKQTFVLLSVKSPQSQTSHRN